MTVRLVPAASSRHDPPETSDRATRWTCAFVNNMPDGAFDATERQFLGLLEAGSGSDIIEVRRYVMLGVPRGARTATRITEQYAPVAAAYVDPPDLLIVTGSNPIAPEIRDVPYWEDLVELLSWARERVPSILLSCLSAHAALAVFDGVERQRLTAKCTGLFLQEVDVANALCSGLEPEVFLPHSRTNTVPEEALRDAGYRIVIRSDAVGWSVATRAFDGSNLVIVQGHPEYEPASLLREYRRDAERYVRHERDDLPPLPYHCVAPEDWEQLKQLHRTIVGGRRELEPLASYPFEEVSARANWPWRSMAQRFYANWLAGETKRKD